MTDNISKIEKLELLNENDLIDASKTLEKPDISDANDVRCYV